MGKDGNFIVGGVLFIHILLTEIRRQKVGFQLNTSGCVRTEQKQTGQSDSDGLLYYELHLAPPCTT